MIRNVYLSVVIKLDRTAKVLWNMHDYIPGGNFDTNFIPNKNTFLKKKIVKRRANVWILYKKVTCVQCFTKIFCTQI